MSTKKNQLFRIISALQPTEKAYLKKFGLKTQRTDAIIFTLLNLIEKELKKGEVQEEKIIEVFTKLKPKANYIKVKARLLQVIFDAIKEYDSNTNELSALFELFSIAESLQKRKLISDSISVLKKAEKLAFELEETELLIRIKVQILFAESFVKPFEKKYILGTLFQETFDEIEHLKKKIQVKDAAQKVLYYQKIIGLPRSDEDQNLLKSVSETIGLSIPLHELDNTSKIDQTLSKCVIFFTNSEFSRVIEVCENFTQTYQSIPISNKKLQGRYIALYDAMMQACLMSKQLNKFDLAYQKFKNIKVDKIEHIRLKTGVDLYVRCISAVYKKKLSVFKGLHKEFDALATDELIPNYRKVSMSYFLILGSFIAGEWPQAHSRIAWLNQQKDLSIRYDIDIAVKVMGLLIHVEREEWFHLEYSIRTFQQFLENRARKFEIEHVLLRFLKKFFLSLHDDKFNDLLIDLKLEIEEAIEKNAAEAYFLQSFDLITWIDSKLQKKPFADLYLNRLNILK